MRPAGLLSHHAWRAGTERASRGGVSLARLHANSEGSCRGMSPAFGGIMARGARKDLTW
jgi:hypothetical protein